MGTLGSTLLSWVCLSIHGHCCVLGFCFRFYFVLFLALFCFVFVCLFVCFFLVSFCITLCHNCDRAKFIILQWTKKFAWIIFVANLASNWENFTSQNWKSSGIWQVDHYQGRALMMIANRLWTLHKGRGRLQKVLFGQTWSMSWTHSSQRLDMSRLTRHTNVSTHDVKWGVGIWMIQEWGMWNREW